MSATATPPVTSNESIAATAGATTKVEPVVAEPKTEEAPKEQAKEATDKVKAPESLIAATKAAAPAVEFTAPEGESMDPVVLTTFGAAVGELGIDAKNAQELLNRVVPAMRESHVRYFAEQVTKWGEETKADPQFGGKNLEANIGKVERFLRKVDTQGELRAALNELGLGSNVRVLRVLARAGELFGDAPILGSGDPAKPAAPSREDILRERYPEVFQGR